MVRLISCHADSLKPMVMLLDCFRITVSFGRRSSVGKGFVNEGCFIEGTFIFIYLRSMFFYLIVFSVKSRYLHFNYYDFMSVHYSDFICAYSYYTYYFYNFSLFYLFCSMH